MAERPQCESSGGLGPAGRPRLAYSTGALPASSGRPANPSIVRSPAGPCCARRTNRPGRWPPGIDGYAELVEPARGAGLTLSLDVEGEPRALPAGIDLAPYRILQEALTNVRKHAPGGRAAVRTRYRLLRQAAALDQEAADLERARAEGRLRSYRSGAALFAERGALREGLSLDDAAAIIHATGHPDLYRFLVIEQNWTADHWATWVRSTLEAGLLAPKKPRHDRTDAATSDRAS
jgi:hypothetical protein